MSDLPAGWRMVHISEVAEVGPKKASLPPEKVVSFVPMPRVEEISGRIDLSETISAADGKRRSLSYFEDGDVIFAKITPCMENGKIALAEGLAGGAAFGSTEFHVLRPGPEIDARYLRYFLVHGDFRAEAERAMTGAVGQRRVPKSFLAEHPIPLPPLDEQQRIVATLEDHLSRLDAASGGIRGAASRVATLRASHWQSVFASLDEETLTLGEVADVSWGDTSITKSSYVHEGFTAFSATGPDGLLDHFDYETEGLVLSAIGAQCGKVWKADGRWSCIKNTMRILPREDIASRDYLFCFLSNHNVWPRRGSGQPFITQKDARLIMIPVPSLEEQQAVVASFEALSESAERLVRESGILRTKSDHLRMSLLNAAFSGQLTKEPIGV